MILQKKRSMAFTAALMLCAAMLLPSTAFAAHTERMLVPMGKTVGIQIYTDGVVVAGLTGGDGGSAAAKAGLLPGDLIIGIGADEIKGAEDLKAVLPKLSGNKISVTVVRGEQTLQLTLTPDMTNGAPELGMWLRDSISGLGTLTYFDPKTGMYGGLGHGINDSDTGMLLPVGRGEIMISSVSDVVKGSVGAPGELCGALDKNAVCGTVIKNTGCGIFGELKMEIPSDAKAVPVATEKEIQLGKACILANVDGCETAEYEVEIVRVYRGDLSGRSMMLSVTDERLLERTGGIVQGMSGSPIIQNGKLIGAVTHVLVNDPTKGFGVSAEMMLNTMDGLLKNKAA